MEVLIKSGENKTTHGYPFITVGATAKNKEQKRFPKFCFFATHSIKFPFC